MQHDPFGWAKDCNKQLGLFVELREMVTGDIYAQIRQGLEQRTKCSSGLARRLWRTV